VVRLATHKHELRELQRKVRRARRTSVLFNTRRLTLNLERAFWAMWSRHERAGKPGHLDIKAYRDAAPSPSLVLDGNHQLPSSTTGAL
jgi:hypothetical protein